MESNDTHGLEGRRIQLRIDDTKFSKEVSMEDALTLIRLADEFSVAYSALNEKWAFVIIQF